MSSESFNSASANDMAEMIDASTSPELAWSDDDLASMWRHQLAGRLVTDLSLHGDVSAEDAATISSIPTPPIESFAELFAHPDPPLKLLIWTKDFAKHCRADADSGLPGEIAVVLYFLSIALARVRCGRSITNLSEKQVREGIDWVCEQPWVDANTNRLMEKLKAELGAE